MIALPSELSLNSGKLALAKSGQLSGPVSASHKMPWDGDLSLLLTPESEDFLLLSDKPMEQAQPGLTSPLESLLTPMSSTISPPELLGDLSGSSENILFGGSPLFDEEELEDPSTWDSLFNEVSEVSDSAKTDSLLSLELPSGLELSSLSSTVLEEISIKSEPMSAPLESVELPKSNKRKRREHSTDESGEYKKDALGITAYSRKPRSAPLVPIVIDESVDTVQAKRARNTAAARRSRARKLERMTQLEEKVEELLALNNSLQTENSQLRCDISDLRKVCGLE